MLIEVKSLGFRKFKIFFSHKVGKDNFFSNPIFLINLDFFFQSIRSYDNGFAYSDEISMNSIMDQILTIHHSIFV